MLRLLTVIVPFGEGNPSQAWYFIPVVPDMRPKQEDGEFRANLSYIVRPYFKEKKLILFLALSSSNLTLNLFELSKKMLFTLIE